VIFKKKVAILPVLFFLLILSTFLYLLSIDRNPSEVPSALLDKKIPLFKTNTLLTKKIFISSNELKGKISIVNFFATWCKPCRDEHPYIKKLSIIQNIKTVGINYKDNNNKTKQWLSKSGNPYSIIAIDKKGTIAIDWGVYGIPETFIIDSNGIIKYRHVGPINKKIYKKIVLMLNELQNESK
jgi:cytochrome c biogenesis protein CcmG, thiol:disulfide interchange protein DsbE